MADRSSRNWRIGLLFLVLAAGGFWGVRALMSRPQPEEVREQQTRPAERTSASIGCVGRFVTDDPVLRVAAPYFESRPSVLTRLLVREGDWVRAGQVIALLDGRRQMEASRDRAAAELAGARRRLEQVRAGAKASDLAAQRAEVARLESVRQLALQELGRDEKLLATGDIPAARLDRSRSALESSNQARQEAQHRLAAMTEVRREDEQVAEAEVATAQARVSEIEARLAATSVVAPAAGRVIKVHAHAGEIAGDEGILDLADSTRMAVEAEVYAADIGRIRPGQRASIEVEGHAGAALQGEVVRVGARVRKPASRPNDPVAYSDANVVPVHIRIISGCGVAGACPIDGRVRVIIGTQP